MSKTSIVQVWLDRRVSRGPGISIDGGDFEVSWPPHEHELDLL